MKNIIITLFISFFAFSAYSAYSASTPPAGIDQDCIQYTDECGNMCIRRKNDTRKCDQKNVCSTKREIQCVSKTNDVFDGQLKPTPKAVSNSLGSSGYTAIITEILRSPLIPWTHKLFPIAKLPSTTSSPDWSISICDSFGNAPVCGTINRCVNNQCNKTLLSYGNRCLAENAGAKEITEWSCPEVVISPKKKRNNLKRRIIHLPQ